MYKIHTEHYLVIYNNKCCPTRHGNLHHSVFGTEKKKTYWTDSLTFYKSPYP